MAARGESGQRAIRRHRALPRPRPHVRARALDALNALRLAALATLLLPAAILGIAVGGVALEPGRLVDVLLHPYATSDAATIVWALRVPRVAVAAVAGIALAIAGTVMQALLRNPLVDPYITGVSSGAAAAIAIAVTAGVAVPYVPALGFVSGLGTAALVALLARRGTGIDVERLILAGISISTLFAAIVALVLTRIARGSASDAILAWLAGSLDGRGWSELGAALPYAAVGTFVALGTVPQLNVLRVGERRAQSLGLDLARLQWALLGSASLLTAAAVSLAGLVGFVGLIVPHLARRVVGSDLRVQLPAAAFIGATLVIVADAASRALFAPLEIPLGVLLAFIGVPAFLYLYLRGSARSFT